MYQDAYARHGKTIELGENIALGFRFFIADTQEKAIEQAKPYFEEAMKFAAPLGLLQLSEEQVSAGVTPSTIRVSVGTENIDDIKEDFAQAFDSIK